MNKRKDEMIVHDKPTDFLSVLDRAIQTPGMTVDIIERMLAVQERVVGDQRKIAFMEAMARLQAQLPQITKDGRIVVKGVERSRYARLETIDEAIKPLLAEHGFSFCFDTEETSGGLKLMATLTHREGHAITKSLPLPIDKNEYRNPVQNYGSTVSYGIRYLIKMMLNIVEKGEDMDAAELEPITDEQATDLISAMDELQMNRNRFLLYMGVGEVKDILARDLQKALTAIAAQRDALANKKK